MINVVGPGLSQWDTGRTVIVTDSGANEVHFANPGDTHAPIMKLVDGVANIPDYLLMTGKPLCAYVVLDGVTQECRTFPVKKREKPEKYVYEDDQRNYIYELISDAQAATEEAKQVVQDLQESGIGKLTASVVDSTFVMLSHGFGKLTTDVVDDTLIIK